MHFTALIGGLQVSVMEQVSAEGKIAPHAIFLAHHSSMQSSFVVLSRDILYEL